MILMFGLRVNGVVSSWRYDCVSDAASLSETMLCGDASIRFVRPQFVRCWTNARSKMFKCMRWHNVTCMIRWCRDARYVGYRMVSTALEAMTMAVALPRAPASTVPNRAASNPAEEHATYSRQLYQLV